MSETLSVLCFSTAVKKPRGFLKLWSLCFCCQSSSAPGTGWAQAGWWPPGIPAWSTVGDGGRLGWLHPWNRPVRVPSTLLRSPVRMWFAPCASGQFGLWVGIDKPRNTQTACKGRRGTAERMITLSSASHFYHENYFLFSFQHVPKCGSQDTTCRSKLWKSFFHFCFWKCKK